MKLALIGALMLCGCASDTGIVPMGQDMYLIAKQQATGFPGLGTMRAEILRQASDHCSTLHREMKVLQIDETKPPYILGNFPRSEVQYACLVTGDPDLARTPLAPEPDLIIETRKR